MTERPKNGNLVTVMTSKNTIESIYFEDCSHCTEKIPVVGQCSSCGTDYEHLRTVENYENGFLHYIYECSGCPEDQRKAKKVIKIHEGVTENGEATSKAKELTSNFLY